MVQSIPDMLSFEVIDKSFNATRAVRAVSLQAAPGTVLGLVGENGAGKSTLIKIASGAIAPDSGRLLLDGRPIAPADTNDALALGIASVFQELTLVRELSVEQNLMLTNAPRALWGSIDRRGLRLKAKEILERHRLDIDPAARVGGLPLGQQQMLEIVRAVERQPRVLLLDEATSALGSSEVDWLGHLVTRLQRENAIILFISHRWDEVVRFCNRVAVLRNGKLVRAADTTEISEDEAVRLMTGQDNIATAFPGKRASRPALALSARQLRSRGLRGVDIDLREGEILGLGGLVGQGQGSLLEALFGADDLVAGSISVGGRPFDAPTPRRAIQAGVAYVPQERKTEGLLLDKSVAVNMTLATLRQVQSIFGVIDPGAEARLVGEAMVRAQIRTPGPITPVNQLSGGNQQKVLLEKWLRTKPKILLLNDVTRGVDIGTKHHIYALIAEIAAQGVGVIWYSTDARELVGVVHRVLVLLGGRINAELTGEAVSVDRIIRASVIGTETQGIPGGANAVIAH